MFKGNMQVGSCANIIQESKLDSFKDLSVLTSILYKSLATFASKE